MRGISKRTVLYTEMVVDETIIHSPNLDFFLGRYNDQHPSVVQLGMNNLININSNSIILLPGGSDPFLLAHAAELCQQYGSGYGEVCIA
jgi:tRNA-dihydrouridine synthase A